MGLTCCSLLLTRRGSSTVLSQIAALRDLPKFPEGNSRSSITQKIFCAKNETQWSAHEDIYLVADQYSLAFHLESHSGGKHASDSSVDSFGWLGGDVCG